MPGKKCSACGHLLALSQLRSEEGFRGNISGIFEEFLNTLDSDERRGHIPKWCFGAVASEIDSFMVNKFSEDQ